LLNNVLRRSRQQCRPTSYPLQRFEKWLKAAEDQAAQDWTVNFDLAHDGCARYLSGGTGADETDPTR
ncbi:MAG: hypothetical protein M3069_31350, partial [Chloroflexota bacterium]|nr:hypothetical protein [Chloroflexota bacterium]